MRNIRSQIFRGQRWRVEHVKKLKGADGDIDDPSTTGKVLRLKEGLPPVRELECAIHEGLHGCFWDLDEAAITQSATDLARWLWRLGYRKIHQ